MQNEGIFIIAEIHGPAGELLRELNARFDPRLARYKGPHVTLTGSSGAGPIPADTSAEELRARLLPIAATTPPLTLQLGAPVKFMQSDIVVLPLDPHGPLRVLHDRIATSGLRFQRARFTFSPHVTLSLYPTLTREAERELLGVRVREPVLLDEITVYHTRDPQPARRLLTLRLGAVEEADPAA